jgi:hypothetical protein
LNGCIDFGIDAGSSYATAHRRGFSWGARTTDYRRPPPTPRPNWSSLNDGRSIERSAAADVSASPDLGREIGDHPIKHCAFLYQTAGRPHPSLAPGVDKEAS